MTRQEDEAVARLVAVDMSYLDAGGTVRVLREADAAFAPGQFTVVLGRSGSGKTTALNLLAGLDVPQAGAVWVGGRRIDRLDEAERTAIRRREIGMVFQSHNLVPTLTAAENVQLPLELNAVVREEAAARAEEQLARLGLGTLCHRYPEELSGGERQRVAVARAIVHRPALVLADEPTGNLDLESARHVVAELESLCRERGVTLVMVTHSLEVAGHADRVLALREGRLVAEEAPSA